MAEQRNNVTAEALLKLRHIVPVEPYEVPGVGRVYVHGLTNLEARQWRAEMQAEGPAADPYSDAKFLVRCVRDAAGKPLFKPGDETRLVELPECIVQDLVRLAMRVNGIGPGADEEIRKNLASRIAGS